MCTLLEDLGFKIREPDQNIVQEMSYFCYTKFKIGFLLYDKIFADIGEYNDATWVLEMNLTPEEVFIDRWHRSGSGVFMISDELTLDICNPNSIDNITGFIEESISIARPK